MEVLLRGKGGSSGNKRGELKAKEWGGSGMRTRFVPLYKAHMELSTSTFSPNVYGNGGPLDMADATADLRKSIDGGRGGAICRIAGLIAVSLGQSLNMFGITWIT